MHCGVSLAKIYSILGGRKVFLLLNGARACCHSQVVMNVWNAAQPALLYIVPCVLGAVLLHACIKGELMEVGGGQGKEGNASHKQFKSSVEVKVKHRHDLWDRRQRREQDKGEHIIRETYNYHKGGHQGRQGRSAG